MDDFERELKLGFLDEADQIVSELEQSFLTLETNAGEPGIIDKIFRLAHNMKGSAKAVGFDQLGLFAHEFENVLLKVKNLELTVSVEVISLLLEANDQLSKIVASLRVDLSSQLDLTDLTSRLKDATSGKISASISSSSDEESSLDQLSIPEEVLTAEFEGAEEEASPGISAGFSPGFMEEAPAAQELSPSLAAQPTALLESTAPAPATMASGPTASSPQGATDESIRVSMSRLDKLIDFVGELSILQTVLKEQIYTSDAQTYRKTILQMAKVTKEVQDMSMGLRMVPLKQTFNKMQRIVRDTANTLGKKIQLHLEGEETELDKTVLESVNDPLVHLIRNAVDHGIEGAEQRHSSGKSETGAITLRAFHQAGKLVIEVQDDGGGISGQRLVQKAKEKGLLKSTVEMSEQDGVQLIFHPGFSTKSEVSEVSGRGVGMDVVKTNIEKLQGEVTVETKVGQGTKFQVILPLTLAIIDGMVVELGLERFVVPLSHVHETVKVSHNDIKVTTGMGSVIQLRGEVLPVHRLSDLLARPAGAQDSRIALIVRSSDQPFAVLVDDILRQQQVVIKQLGSELQATKGYSGSAILGDGRPALIVELFELVKHKSPTRIAAAPKPSQLQKGA